MNFEVFQQTGKGAVLINLNQIVHIQPGASKNICNITTTSGMIEVDNTLDEITTRLRNIKKSSIIVDARI